MELIRKRGLCEIKWRLHAVTLVLWGKVEDSNLIIPLLRSWLRLILNIISLHCFTGQFSKGCVHKFSLCATVILQALTCSAWVCDDKLSGSRGRTTGTLGERFRVRKFHARPFSGLSGSCCVLRLEGSRVSLKCIACCVVWPSYSRRYVECGRFLPSKPAGGNQGNNDRSSPRMCCVHIHSWISTYTDRGGKQKKTKRTRRNSAGISQSRWWNTLGQMCLNKWRLNTIVMSHRWIWILVRYFILRVLSSALWRRYIYLKMLSLGLRLIQMLLPVRFSYILYQAETKRAEQKDFQRSFHLGRWDRLHKLNGTKRVSVIWCFFWPYIWFPWICL